MTDVSFSRFSFRVTTCHVVTYFVAGLFAYTLLDYRALFEAIPIMRPIDSAWVAAGPALQVVRGLIFALALYPFRHTFLNEPRGWLKLWGLFLGLAILSTAGPAPGSVEGVIYTKLTFADHLRGLPEVVLQTLALSVLVVTWHRKPHRAWSIVMGILTTLAVLLSLAGVFLERPEGLS
jgi:hypothetical protein